MGYVLLGANFLMILALVFKFNKLPPQIPLFYSHPPGDTQLAEWWLIFIMPILLNFLYWLNSYIQKRLFPQNSLIMTFTYYFKLFLIVSFTLIFLKIVFLIT